MYVEFLATRSQCVLSVHTQQQYTPHGPPTSFTPSICPSCQPYVAQFSLNSIYFLSLSPINAKLTSLSYVHASKYICFSANLRRYHSNNRYHDVRFGNSPHQSSNFSISVLV